MNEIPNDAWREYERDTRAKYRAKNRDKIQAYDHQYRQKKNKIKSAMLLRRKQIDED